MKVVFFDDHVLVTDKTGTSLRIEDEEAKRLALQLNNRFALKQRYQLQKEAEEDARA